MAFWDVVIDRAPQLPQTPLIAYGRRLLPTIIDDNARNHPTEACFSIPRSESLQHGFRDISWRTYANAINRTAHFLEAAIGRSKIFETVLYLGWPDLRAFIVLIALTKTGHKVLYSAHHNSIAAHVNLVRTFNCNILLHTAGFPIDGLLESLTFVTAYFNDVEQKCRMQTVCLPELEALLTESQCRPYPFKKTYEEAKHDPCFIVHTSGSTGLPKPVVWTHWSISTTDNHRNVPPLDGRHPVWATPFASRRRNYCAWPIFNGAGIGAGVLESCFYGTTVVVGPPCPATADVFDQVLTYANIDAASCLPSTLDDISRRPDILVKLSRLRFIAYIGGSISQQAGNVVSRYTSLHNLTGSTETNTIVQHTVDREDWSYICINPYVNGIEMRPVADLFELVFVRSPAHADLQGVFKAFPQLQEYSMRDLYSPHPAKPHHWKHEGRRDDIIVFKNGHNFNPLSHERMIASHPSVRNCILTGTSRNNPAALIELYPSHISDSRWSTKSLLDDIWPYIAKANNIADAFGQLERRFVIFATKNKPFVIGLKGLVQRHATIELYAAEIDELYISVARRGMRGLFQTESLSG